MIEGADVALLGPAIHKVAIRAEARGKILIQRESRRRPVILGKLRFHALIIAPNQRPRQRNPVDRPDYSVSDSAAFFRTLSTAMRNE